MTMTIGALAALTACSAPNHNTKPRARNATGKAIPPANTDSGVALTPVHFVETPEEAPISLTTPDGIALKLISLKAKSVTEGPLAFTELRLAFDNPENRTIEARFAIRLPQAASVSRFAMRIGGRWQEGEMVERQRARRIYEDFLHRRVDPALLEQGAGNEFTARVFPIVAKGRKELIISYSQELTERQQTLVPLRGLPEIAELNVELAKYGSAKPSRLLAKSDHQPKKDFVIKRGKGTATGVRHGDLMAARVTAQVSSKPEPLADTLFLIDSSASRALGLSQQLSEVKRLIKRIAKRDGSSIVSVAAFDQEVFITYTGRADGFEQKALDGIAQRRAMGASELYGALGWARGHCKKHKLSRVVLVGDGVVTAGRRGKALRKRIRALRRGGVERLDVLAFGGIRDDDALAGWVTAGLPRDGVVLASRGTSDTWKRLNGSVRGRMPIKVEGAEWSWPKELTGVQDGDTTIVYAKLKEGSKPVLDIGGKKLTHLNFTETARPLLARSWAKAKVRSLVEQERSKGPSASLRNEIIRLSQKYRVLSPHTGLLVLETQRDYDRYKLRRDSLADILTVQSGKLAVVQRQQPSSGATTKRNRRFPQPDPLSASSAPWGSSSADSGSDPLSARGNMWGDEIGESFGAGGLGLSGIGTGGGGRGEGIGLGSVGTVGRGASRVSKRGGTTSGGDVQAPHAGASRGLGSGQGVSSSQTGQGAGQGFGSGHGRIGRSHRARRPSLRMGSTTVSGRLPPEIIQRIVRQNFGRFRACYEDELRRSPDASGRVTVRFSIVADGSTSNIRARGQFSERMLTCIARAFSSLTFPQPTGGLVTVAYPIQFTPDGGSNSAPPTRATRTVRLPGARQPSAAPTTGVEVPARSQPYRGPFAKIMGQLATGKRKEALSAAQAWHAKKPGDVLALLALGESLEASGHKDMAARAYGSIIDLFPSRADMRRYAGERLDRINTRDTKQLAVDTYEKAREQRPDHPTSHRLLAYALHKQGKHEAAFDAVRQGLKKSRFRGGGVRDVMRADLGLLGAAWLRAEPDKNQLIAEKLQGFQASIPTKPSVRFVLSWETDANDVDLHMYTADGGHLYFSHPTLSDGSRLYGDVTTGYGPELIEVPGELANRGYLLQAHYYSRGAMGYGMGKVQIIEHDGKGKIKLEERPFIVMVDRAYVNLGTFGKYKNKREEP